jgi:FkbM family methyltransferase
MTSSAAKKSSRAARAVKGARLLRTARFRHGLRHGVAATLEHQSAYVAREMRTVIDVGANRGQFTLFALERFPRARIFAFEPLPASARVLEAVTARDKARVMVFRTAIGPVSGTTPFFVSSREDSSSVLEIGENQERVFPGTCVKEVVTIPMETLDRLLRPEDLLRPCLLKVDVQGYEFEVLTGARTTLMCVDELLVEASFIKLYCNQRLASDVIRLLLDAGFCPVAIYDMVSDANGVPVQADFHFIRLERSRNGEAVPSRVRGPHLL